MSGNVRTFTRQERAYVAVEEFFTLTVVIYVTIAVVSLVWLAKVKGWVARSILFVIAFSSIGIFMYTIGVSIELSWLSAALACLMVSVTTWKLKSWILRLLLFILTLCAATALMSLIGLPVGWTSLVSAIICVIVAITAWRRGAAGDKPLSIVFCILAVLFFGTACVSLGISLNTIIEP